MTRLDGRTRSRYQAKAKVMKALAHPTRLFIIDELSQGERCVCDLRDMIGADISTVSKHLALLRTATAHLVVYERRGQQVFYRLRTTCVLDFLNCIQNVQRALGGGAHRKAAG